MKKQQKEFLQNEFENINNKYDLHVYIFNIGSITKEIEQLKKDNESIRNAKKILTDQTIENSSKNEIQSNLKKMHEKKKPLNDAIDKNNIKIEILEVMRKTYKKIIDNGLLLILNDILKLYLENVKNVRDQNEFLKMYNEYIENEKRYKYIYNIYIKSNYIEISYNKPFISQYNIFENSIYYQLNKIDINNNFIFESNYYNYDEIKQKHNSTEYEKKINNNFSYETIEKNTINLLKIYKDEIKKQFNFICESNKKIENANIYKLDGFIKLNANNFYNF